MVPAARERREAVTDSTHVLIKELDTEHAAQFPHSEPHYLYRIECPGRPDCDSRLECSEPHEVDGRTADDGPNDCEDSDPWCGEYEFEFHGVLHLWLSDYGWTAPAERCGADTHPYRHEAASDLLYDHPPGRYPVHVWWDEDDYELKLIENGDQP
jgi:hypothetical protein